MVNTEIMRIDNLKIDRAREISNNIKGIFLLEKFLGGFEGKHILDIGCGTGIDSTAYILDIGCGTGIDTTAVGREYYPYIAKIISRRGGIVYGFDMGFINKSKSDLERFRKETGVIPIPGVIEHIDEILEGKQFDSIISSSVMGYPTKNLDWIETMKKLYPSTKLDGYHHHFKLRGEIVNIDRTSLEEMGFNVLSDFRENNGLGSALVLHKEYNA